MTAPAAADNQRRAADISTTQHTANAAPAYRELASRGRGGVHVRLLWRPDEDVLTVSVGDSRSGHRFDFDVEPGRGLDAFWRWSAHGQRADVPEAREKGEWT
jgi:hypothetical protein